MKTYNLLICLVFCIFSCDQKEKESLQKDTIIQKKKEIGIKKQRKDKKLEVIDSLEWKNKEPYGYGFQYISYKYYDINKDGYKDSLISEFLTGNGGSSYQTYIIKSGKEQKILKRENQYSPAFVKDIIEYPVEYNNKENKDFFEVLKNTGLPKASKPSPSLQWIIEATLSQRNIWHPYFNQVFRFKPRFIKGKFKFPISYYLEVNNDTLYRLCSSKYQKNNSYPLPSNKLYCLEYGGRGLYRLNEEVLRTVRNPKLKDYKILKKVGESKSYALYTLPHAVIARKGESYAWIFVSDYDLTGGPEKMRWNAIKNAELMGKYAIIYHNSSNSHNQFIVNIETGLCLKLNLPNSVNFEVLLKEMDKLE